MAKKATNHDADYVEENLDIIRKNIDSAKKYLEDNPWKDQNSPEKAFEFHTKIVDKITEWNREYSELCGIMEVFNTVNSRKTSLRKGNKVSGIRQVINDI